MKNRIKQLLQRKSLALLLVITMLSSTLASNLFIFKTAYSEDNQVESVVPSEYTELVDETVYDLRYDAKDIVSWLLDCDLSTPVELEELLTLIPFQGENSYEELRSRFELSTLYIIKSNLIADNTQLVEGCDSYVIYEVDASGNENIIFFIINRMEIERHFKITIPGLDTSSMEIYSYHEISNQDTQVASGGAITVTITPVDDSEGEVATGSSIDVEIGDGEEGNTHDGNIEEGSTEEENREEGKLEGESNKEAFKVVNLLEHGNVLRNNIDTDIETSIENVIDDEKEVEDETEVEEDEVEEDEVEEDEIEEDEIEVDDETDPEIGNKPGTEEGNHEGEEQSVSPILNEEDKSEYEVESSVTKGESLVGENGIAFASVSLALIQSLTQGNIRYLDVDFYDYNGSSLNSAINRGSGSNKFYVAKYNRETQNDFTGDTNGVGNGVAQGIANDTITSNADLLRFSTGGVNIFQDNQNNGITAYRNYGFPLEADGEGYYVFDSEKKHVYIGDFTVENNIKNLLLKDGTRVINNTLSGFFPFNKANTSANYLFSMELSGDFIYPKEGKVNDKDVIFEFSGDDDVWLYMKDDSMTSYKLVLDLGGIHRKQSGSINLSTGLIKVDKVRFIYNGSSWQTMNNITQYWYLYNESTFNQMKSEGRIEQNITISKFLGFSRNDYKQYNFKLFYMERGEGESNCYIKLNFPLIDTKKVTVLKEVENLQEGNKENLYKFDLFVDDNMEDFTPEYLNDSKNIKETRYLQAGQQVTFDVSVLEGQYYVIRENRESEDIFTASWIYNSNGETKQDDGYVTQPLSLADTNFVRCINTYPSAGTLTITKSVSVDYERNTKPTENNYQFIVEISNIPEGEKDSITYGNGGEVLNPEGNDQSLVIIFTLKNQESYLIENIPAECNYKVIEVNNMGELTRYYDHRVEVDIDGKVNTAVEDDIEDYEPFNGEKGFYVSGSGFGSVKEIVIEDGYTITYEPKRVVTYTYTCDGIDYPITDTNLIVNNKYKHENIDFVSKVTPVKRSNNSNQWGVWVGPDHKHYNSVAIKNGKEGMYYCKNDKAYENTTCSWFHEWLYGCSNELVIFRFLEAYHLDDVKRVETLSYEYNENFYGDLEALAAAIRGNEGNIINDITKNEDGKVFVTYNAGTLKIYSPSNITVNFNNKFLLLKGKITVNKILVDVEDYVESFTDSEDNTFIFTLKNVDEDSPGFGLEYQREVHIKADESTESTVFHDLPMGTYEIKEIDHMRYNQVQPLNQMPINLMQESKDDNELAGPNRTVEYKNYKTPKGYFSHTDVTVNKVETLEDFTKTFKRYIYKNGVKVDVNDTLTNLTFEVVYIKEKETED